MGISVISGNFLSALGKPNAVVIAPTNGVVRDGELVMGVGAARSLAQRVPALRRTFARLIEERGEYVSDPGAYIYGFVVAQIQERLYGAFQTKLHYLDKASLLLIRVSSWRLYRFLRENPKMEAHMAYPGVGYGKLDPERVMDALLDVAREFANVAQILPESLTSRVFLYLKEKS